MGTYFADRKIGTRSLSLAGASLFCLMSPSFGQEAGTETSPGANVVLPAITVEGQGAESPTGPIEGYVARRSVTSTKTDTPLREVPQQVSVIGREQIRAQNARKVDEAIRYTAGVFAQQFGPDTRNDWFFLRGFDSTQTGLYKDSLHLFSTALAAWKIDPFGLEQIEVLKGPSSMVFGGTAPGGILNLTSKRPPEQTLRYAETGFDDDGQFYAGLDAGGPLTEDGRLLSRIVTRGHLGGTGTDNADDEGAFVAPSFTWRPNEDTSLTLLSMYQKDNVGQLNGFLPYEGTEVA